MDRNELTAALHARPFRPFRLFVSDGDGFEIGHPEMLMVTRRTAIVGIVAVGGQDETGNGSEFPDIERAATVDLLHITRIEDIPESRGRAT